MKLSRRNKIILLVCCLATLVVLSAVVWNRLSWRTPQSIPPQLPPNVAKIEGTLSGLEEGDKVDIMAIIIEEPPSWRMFKLAYAGNGDWWGTLPEEGTYLVMVATWKFTPVDETTTAKCELLNYTSSPLLYRIEVVEGYDVTGLNFTLSKK